ncbi:MAG: triphosphoribosyl-dephospho-CoA synthase [Pseudoclavibacter sp.]
MSAAELLRPAPAARTDAVGMPGPCTRLTNTPRPGAAPSRLPATRLASLAQRALLAEAEAFPKPGLVDPLGHSTHPDMDLATFIASAIVLGPYLRRFVDVGAASRAAPPENLLLRLRPVGVRAEQAMLHATRGINTHRGAIFVLGLALGACGRLQARGSLLQPELVLDEIAAISTGIVQRELASRPTRGNSPESHGEQLFRRHGITGVRGQAEAGFPLVRDRALPTLRAAMACGDQESGPMAMVDTLLAIAAANDDTTTMARGGISALAQLQDRAAAANAAGGSRTLAGRRSIRALCRWATVEHLSLGGSADLLSLTVLLLEIERLCSP